MESAMAKLKSDFSPWLYVRNTTLCLTSLGFYEVRTPSLSGRRPW